MRTNSDQGSEAARVCFRAFFAAAVFVALFTSLAGAQVFYTYPGAPPVKKDEPAVGVNVGFGDKLLRTLGYGRFNVNARSDLGLEIVADNTDTYSSDVWRWGAGIDYKYAIVPEETTMPFDLAANGGFGFQSGGDMTNFNVPAGAMISRPLELEGGRVLVPYGGVYVLLQYTSWDLPAGAIGDDSDWELEVELRAGAGFEINKATLAYAALFLGAGTKFYLGINFLL
jgi:hypothetical protein